MSNTTAALLVLVIATSSTLMGFTIGRDYEKLEEYRKQDVNHAKVLAEAKLALGL